METLIKANSYDFSKLYELDGIFEIENYWIRIKFNNINRGQRYRLGNFLKEYPLASNPERVAEILNFLNSEYVDYSIGYSPVCFRAYKANKYNGKHTLFECVWTDFKIYFQYYLYLKVQCIYVSVLGKLESMFCIL